MGRILLPRPSNNLIDMFGDRSDSRSKEKNSLFGPPPSMEGSSSNVIKHGFLISKLGFFKIPMLSWTMDNLDTFIRLVESLKGQQWGQNILQGCGSCGEHISTNVYLCIRLKEIKSTKRKRCIHILKYNN